MVAVCWDVTLAGAVYKPVLLIVPALAVQVTATFAVNCCVWPADSVAVEGVTVTVTGVYVTVLDTDVAFPAASVATTVSVFTPGVNVIRHQKSSSQKNAVAALHLTCATPERLSLAVPRIKSDAVDCSE